MRRRLWLLGCLLVAALALPAAVDAAPEPARDAAGLVDAVGVNVHTSWTGTAYERADLVLAALERLHVRHVRDSLAVGGPSSADRQHTYYDLLAARGVRGELIAPRPGSAGSDPAALAQAAATRLRGFVSAIEGPNELDLAGVPGWAAALRDYQGRLYAAVRARAELAGVPVIGPSFARLGSFGPAWPLEASSDAGNVHLYPQGSPEAAARVIDQNLQAAALLYGAGPVYATEAGYDDALCDSSGQLPVSRRAAGAYVPRLILDLFSRGVARTFIYELVDYKPDASGCWRSQHFGLFDSAFRPKPQAIALARLLDRLDGPATPIPGTLDVALDGAAGIRHLLLQRADGTFVMVLWQDVDVWDPVARRELHPPARAVELELPSAMQVRCQRPLSDERPSAGTVARDVPLAVPGDDLLVVEIKPPEPAEPGPAHAPPGEPEAARGAVGAERPAALPHASGLHLTRSRATKPETRCRAGSRRRGTTRARARRRGVKRRGGRREHWTRC